MPENKASDWTRDRDLSRVSGEIANRLETLGIALTGRETPDELVELQEAVERFETAVRGHGGDLMVDEGPRGVTRQPDRPEFAFPVRAADETVAQYCRRLQRATDAAQSG